MKEHFTFIGSRFTRIWWISCHILVSLICFDWWLNQNTTFKDAFLMSHFGCGHFYRQNDLRWGWRFWSKWHSTVNCLFPESPPPPLIESRQSNCSPLVNCNRVLSVNQILDENIWSVYGFPEKLPRFHEIATKRLWGIWLDIITDITYL